MVVALVALAAARAQAGSMYTHSARNGTFVGGRLTLHGVGRNVTWITTGGRSGVAPITLAQKRLFVRNTQARGVLHIAGQRGGQEFTFRLSGPRYSAARSTVSYRAAPLTKVAVAARAAAAVPRRFGAASLSVLPTSSRGRGRLGSAPLPALGSGDNGGNDCENAIWNDTDSRTSQGNPIQLVSSQQWDTDDWLSPPRTNLIFFNDAADVISEGGTWRG